ncbi:MAG: hypothetical protein OQK82_00570, partial [Candidatus Pacearchaeota archaeon]|nr:hypothetical protein [Candidatus Pacearchaeota archaeon]
RHKDIIKEYVTELPSRDVEILNKYLSVANVSGSILRRVSLNEEYGAEKINAIDKEIKGLEKSMGLCPKNLLREYIEAHFSADFSSTIEDENNACLPDNLCFDEPGLAGLH